MGAADRHVVYDREAEPRIAELEWYAPHRGLWIGRRPRSGEAPPARRSEPAGAASAEGD